MLPNEDTVFRYFLQAFSSLASDAVGGAREDLTRAEYREDPAVIEAQKEMINMCDDLLTFWCRHMKESWGEFVDSLVGEVSHPAAISHEASATYYFVGACLRGCEADWKRIMGTLAVDDDEAMDFFDLNIKDVYIDSWDQARRHFSLAI